MNTSIEKNDWKKLNIGKIKAIKENIGFATLMV